ncbi:MAG TPA: O-antigen polymerase [Gemmatimonadaceae bacterium]|nr:O-antigen polymerase [Gemmatimonadaceae bacterium]
MSGETPIVEVGAWYAVAGTIYLLLPLSVFLALGMVFVPTSDGRLFSLQPDPGEVARIAWMYVIHIGAFGLAYVSVRGRPKNESREQVVSRRTMVTGLVLFVVLSTGLYGINMLLPRPENYADSYAVVMALPLGVRQALKFVFGVNFVITILLLVGAFSDYRRWRRVILMWLAFQFLMTILFGIRAGLVLSFCACIILYHLKVRRIRMLAASLLALSAVVGFLVLGIVRNYRGAERRADFTVALNGGEFEALFANAVDIDRRRQTGEIDGAPPGAYLADFVAPIPSQILPFEKVNLATWYVGRFYPSAREQGGGFAFGVIAQSALGYGWLELVTRGIVLGWVLAKTHRLFSRRRGELWITVFYVWLIVNGYQSFRDTSFTLWSSFVQQFVPAFIIVECLAAILAQVSRLSGRPARTSPAVTPS